MDITPSLSSSKGSESSKNVNGESMPQNEAKRTHERYCHGSPPPVHQEQLQLNQHPFSSPWSNCFYPPSFPFPPTMSYMDFMRNLTLEQSQLQKFEDLPNETNSKDFNTKSQYAAHMTQCDFLHCKDLIFGPYSRLCSTCEQHFRFSCCQNPFVYLYPLPPLMYTQYFPAVPRICACQMQKEEITRNKSKHKYNNSKTNQICSQSDRNNKERDNIFPQVTKKEITSKKGNFSSETCESSSSGENIGVAGNTGECYESNYESKEYRSIGSCMGEGDKHDKTKKSQSKKKEKRTRRPVSYFLDV